MGSIRTRLIVVVAVVVATLVGFAGFGWWFLGSAGSERPRALRWLAGSHGDWTTASHEAVEVFEQGLQAMARYYFSDARESFLRALELDEDFAMAKLQLLLVSDPGSEEGKRLLAELEDVPVEGLRDRERYLISYRLARLHGDVEEAERLLERFASEFPDDLFALRATCDFEWEVRQDLHAAENCYQRLLEDFPNWVQAQNRLGYILMSQGRFEGAEERFRTYQFIAPDQANPHDSMGELLVVRGEYDQANRAFERAIEIRSDFCAAHLHRLMLCLYQEDPELCRRAIRDAAEEPACSDSLADERCVASALLEAKRGRYRSAWREIEGRCPEVTERPGPIVYRLALQAGETETLDRLEAKLEGMGAEEHGKPREKRVGGLLDHLLALRAKEEGRVDEALDLFASADATLSYWFGQELFSLKQLNRSSWLDTLETSGRDPEAARRLRDEIERVNPELLRRSPLLPAPVDEDPNPLATRRGPR